jgi:hypothetical protein
LDRTVDVTTNARAEDTKFAIAAHMEFE